MYEFFMYLLGDFSHRFTPKPGADEMQKTLHALPEF
jgi:hypothetical protein